MTNEKAIEILQKIKPIPHRGDNKSTTHLLQTIALDMAIKALEQESMLDKIEEEINSPNRGTCDYFIVDRIEEIINKYKAERSEE